MVMAARSSGAWPIVGRGRCRSGATPPELKLNLSEGQAAVTCQQCLYCASAS